MVKKKKGYKWEIFRKLRESDGMITIGKKHGGGVFTLNFTKQQWEDLNNGEYDKGDKI